MRQSNATSRLQRVINHYLQQLHQHDEQAVRALVTAHQNTLGVIQTALDKLYRQIDERQQQDGSIPPSWLYEQNRLQSIKQIIATQIDQYATFALVTTTKLQQQAAQLGQQSAHQQLQATVPSGIKWAFGLPSPAAILRIIGATQAGSPLADLFRGFGDEAAAKAGKALITGVTLGWNPRRVAPLIEQALDEPRWRALTAARSEMIRSYRGASIETYRENSEVTQQWRWTCAKTPRTCPACLAMDGKLFDLDEEMGSHPCCMCTPVPVVADWTDILGKYGIDTSNIPDSRPQIKTGAAWLDEQSADVQQKIMGRYYEGWSNGDFALADLVGHKHDADWGSSIYVKPLKELVA